MKPVHFVLLLFAISLCVSQTDAQWVQTSSPPGGGVLSILASGSNLFVGTRGDGVFQSIDCGSSWSPTSAGLTNLYVYSLAITGSNVYAGTDNGVFLSTNNGVSWTAINSGIPEGTRVCGFVINGGGIFAGTWKGIFHSTDNGASWNAANSGLIYTAVYSIFLSGQTLFAGIYSNGVYRSSDNGTSWTAANSGIRLETIHSICSAGSNLFAASLGGVFLSTDGGTSWVRKGVSKMATALAVSGANVFVGTYDGGVFLSTDSGTHWTAVNDSLTNLSVSALAVSGMYLLDGTNGSGVWRRPLSDMLTSVDPTASDLPNQFVLQQNYPNPFNPSTNIRFGLPTKSQVTLAVFNTLGQEVATLVQGEKEAGYHEAQFDGAGLSSGVCFYRMTAGDYVATKRLLILK